jgi:hypothetical protein
LVDQREAPESGEEYGKCEVRVLERAELRDRPTVASDADRLAVFHTVDHLTTVVTEFSDRNVVHAPTVSPVIQRVYISGPDTEQPVLIRDRIDELLQADLPR